MSYSKKLTEETITTKGIQTKNSSKAMKVYFPLPQAAAVVAVAAAAVVVVASEAFSSVHQLSSSLKAIAAVVLTVVLVAAVLAPKCIFEFKCFDYVCRREMFL
jgi:hypothetical protein